MIEQFEMLIVLFLLFCVHLRPSADLLVNDVGLLYDNPIFGHTWVELYTSETGWLPVEFHGIALSSHAMTADNVADPLLRQRIEEHSEAFLDYYFGHIDCHRVMCSKSVLDIPQLMVPNPNAATEPNRPLTMPEGLHYECHLTLECQ